jgi:hypothetical protein
MVGVADRIGAASALRAAAAFLVLGVGGCSGSSGISGADITKVASTGISAVTGAQTAEEANQEIELRARHPLVLPPDYKLRPPVSASQEEQQLGAAWPEDPDIKAKELAALDAARSKAEYDKLRKSPQGRATALTPEQLAAGMVAPSSISRETPVQVARVAPDQALSADELLERHRTQQQASPQLLAANQQDTGKQAVDGVQYQTQEVSEPAPPPPKKKDLWDRLVFWD